MKTWYENPKWLRIRQSALRRDKYMDMERKRYGIAKQAEVVHHIFPKDEFPEYAYEMWNLISLTRETHNQMHDRDMNTLSEKGIELLCRTCRKLGKEIPPQYREKKARKRKEFRSGYYYD